MQSLSLLGKSHHARSRVPHDLLWDATYVNAGSTHATAFDHSDFSTVLGGTTGGGDTAGTAPNHEEIVRLLGGILGRGAKR